MFSNIVTIDYGKQCKGYDQNCCCQGNHQGDVLYKKDYYLLRCIDHGCDENFHYSSEIYVKAIDNLQCRYNNTEKRNTCRYGGIPSTSLYMSTIQPTVEPLSAVCPYEAGSCVEVIRRIPSPESPLAPFEKDSVGLRFFVYSHSLSEGRLMYALRLDCGMGCGCVSALPEFNGNHPDPFAAMRHWEDLSGVYAGFPAESLKLIHTHCVEIGFYVKQHPKRGDVPTFQSLPWKDRRKRGGSGYVAAEAPK